MKRSIILPLALVCLSASPVIADEEQTELLNTDKLFEFLEEFTNNSENFIEDLFAEFGPSLEALQDSIQDWSLYEAPEVLENGDIIIRRKPSTDKKPLPEGTKEI